ncbi:MAG: prenyltransferase [Bacteroidales bacterium]|jgi:1,4-dihydroxy-2-naphthoate octaprenyltransferase|nr:prenyltransferase [Bacteroidales bacterium]
MKHSVKEWFLATRPWSLTASSMPALVAISYIFYIDDKFININWIYGLLGLLGAIIFQIGGNLLNDYFDFKYNVDRKDTYSSRTLVDNIFTSKSIFNFGLISLIAGSIIGIYLMLNTGWHLLWIGILGFLGSYFYYKLKYIALGDLNIFIIYGLLISLGIGYVMTGELIWNILLVSSPVGFLIVGILHANNTRDILNDQKAGIKTPAMKLGLKASKLYFLLLNFGAYIMILLLLFFKILPPLCISIFFILPISIRNIRQMNEAGIENLEKIKYLAESMAKLVMLFSLMYAISNFIAGLV